jgi:hypothetical protein
LKFWNSWLLEEENSLMEVSKISEIIAVKACLLWRLVGKGSLVEGGKATRRSKMQPEKEEPESIELKLDDCQAIMFQT